MKTVEMVDSDTLHRATETGPTGAYSGLLIGPDEVHAGLARELQSLADLGLSEPQVLTRAIAITAAKIRNSSVLAEHQAHPGRCHACGDPLDDSRPVVAVLQARPGRPLFLHHGECHAEHSGRGAALVEDIMRAAGYGADQRTGEAA